MLVPMVYLVASRIWRGHSPEQPLARVAHAATAVIWAAGLLASVHSTGLGSGVASPAGRDGQPAAGRLLCPRRPSSTRWPPSCVAAAGPSTWPPRPPVPRSGSSSATGKWRFPTRSPCFAVLGVVFLVLSRLLGVHETDVYRPSGWKTTVLEGRGLTAYQAGHTVVFIATLASILFGLSQLAIHHLDWPLVGALGLTILAGLAAAALACDSIWRRIHITGAVAVAAVSFLTLNILIALSLWRKLEIFCVVLGLVTLVASSAGRFRESKDEPNELVGRGPLAGKPFGGPCRW